MHCRRLSSAQTVLEAGSYSDVLEANVRVEAEELGSEGDLSELGDTEKCLREGTGGSSCDGGDVSGGVMTDRENED